MNTMTLDKFNEMLKVLGDVVVESFKARVYTDPDTNQRMIDIQEFVYHSNN